MVEELYIPPNTDPKQKRTLNMSAIPWPRYTVFWLEEIL